MFSGGKLCGHTVGYEVRLLGAAASETALLTGDKINTKTKPKWAHEIYISVQRDMRRVIYKAVSFKD